MSIADACADIGCDEPRAIPETVGDAQHDLQGRVDTSALYQPFLMTVNGVLNNCYRRGAIYVATCADRSFPKQDALYAIGRTVPPIGKDHIVTKAKGGQSPHNFKAAEDFARHKGSTYAGKLDPDYDDDAYRILAEEATAAGLDAGYYWPEPFKDAQHIALPIKRWGYSWAQLAEIWRRGGDAALFAEYDKHFQPAAGC